MITLKSSREIALMREAGKIVAEAHRLARERVAPGVTTRSIDEAIEEMFAKAGVEPLFKGVPGKVPFPAVTCISVNEQVVHGIPSRRQLLHEGDIIGIDVGAIHNGWYGDSCITVPVGKVSPEAMRLLRVTEECLYLGIEQCYVGKTIGDIGHAIQTHAEGQGYGVVLGLGGHGIGRKMHEEEPSVQHAGEPGTGIRLRPGMVFTIEPMINQGTPDWRELNDGWTIVTKDGKLSAQFEHTIAITEDGPLILSKLED